MSPFSQLGHQLGYGGGIDRDFGLVVNYMDELERHFSHRHRLMNCFFPRFDLEEDDDFYYLCGEIPGGKAEDISIEPHDSHTIAIFGTTHHSYSGPSSPGHGTDHLDANVYPAPDLSQEFSPRKTDGSQITSTANSRKPIRLPAPHFHSHADHSTTSHIAGANTTDLTPRPRRKTLLGERIIGRFYRTFAFPTPVTNEDIQAILEDGLLALTIPKQKGRSEGKPKKIPIIQRS